MQRQKWGEPGRKLCESARHSLLAQPLRASAFLCVLCVKMDFASLPPAEGLPAGGALPFVLFACSEAVLVSREEREDREGAGEARSRLSLVLKIGVHGVLACAGMTLWG